MKETAAALSLAPASARTAALQTPSVTDLPVLTAKYSLGCSCSQQSAMRRLHLPQAR